MERLPVDDRGIDQRAAVFADHIIEQFDLSELRVDRDTERTRFLEAEGYRVIRFWNNDVLGNAEGVVARIVEVLDANSPTRPDSYYGLSKVFGEQLSRYYFDRAGIETVCLRIGSSFPSVNNPRMMCTWLSYDDLLEALRVSLLTPRVGHTILFGASNNKRQWWDNRKAAHLGFQPKDSSEQFRDAVPESGEYPPADDATFNYHGGKFIFDGPMYKD